MVKITDVAALAGVAKSTVSNVLTGRKYVSDELRKKVEDACRELDFHPNFYASSLSSRKTNILALLIGGSDDIKENQFYGELMVSCVAEASAKGYSLLTYYDKDMESLLAVLRLGRAPIDGAIIMAPCVNDQRFTELAYERIHCVSIGRPDSVADMSYVDVDNKGFVYYAVKTLKTIYSGPVYLANASRKLTISSDRDAGFESACDELGISTGGLVEHYDRCSEEDGYNFAKPRVCRNCVFITANSSMCHGIYRAINEAGLKIGEDVGVFALGRSIEGGVFTPKLSYGKQDYSEIGRIAVDMLIGEIEHDAEHRAVYVENKINFRDSTQKINR